MQIEWLVEVLSDRARDFHPTTSGYRGVNKSPERSTQIYHSKELLRNFQSIVDSESQKRIRELFSFSRQTELRLRFENNSYSKEDLLEFIVSYISLVHQVSEKALSAASVEVQSFLEYLMSEKEILEIINNPTNQQTIQKVIQDRVIFWLRFIKLGEGSKTLNGGLDGTHLSCPANANHLVTFFAKLAFDFVIIYKYLNAYFGFDIVVES